MLTGASTVAVEAMLMDVPVVTMDFRDEIHEVDFIDAGATMHVRTGEALVEAVAEILAGQCAERPSPSRACKPIWKNRFAPSTVVPPAAAARSLVEQIEQGTSR